MDGAAAKRPDFDMRNGPIERSGGWANFFTDATSHQPPATSRYLGFNGGIRMKKPVVRSF